MHKKVFPIPAIEAKHRQGLLGQHFDCFLTWMRNHGYSRCSIRFQIQCITHFGKYLKRRGIHSIHQLEGTEGQKLLTAYRKYCQSQRHWRRDSGLKLYLGALEEAGILRSPPPKDSSLYPETKQYSSFLETQRGLSDGSIHRHLHPRRWRGRAKPRCGAALHDLGVLGQHDPLHADRHRPQRITTHHGDGSGCASAKRPRRRCISRCLRFGAGRRPFRTTRTGVGRQGDLGDPRRSRRMAAPRRAIRQTQGRRVRDDRSRADPCCYERLTSITGRGGRRSGDHRATRLQFRRNEHPLPA